MATDVQKQLKQLRRKLERRGFEVKLGGGDHWQVRQDGKLLVSFSASPSRLHIDQVYRDLRDKGIDVRMQHRKRKTSMDDFQMTRLRERIASALGRGVTTAQFGRLLMVVQEEKRLAGIGSPDSAMQALKRLNADQDGRVTRPVFESLAATLNIIESATPDVLARKVREADERFGVRARIVAPPPPAPTPEPTPVVEPTPEPEATPPAQEQHVVVFRLEIPAAERAWLRELILEVVRRP